MPLDAQQPCAYIMCMRHAHTSSPKKAVNLSLASAMVAEAKALGLNMSQGAEEGLRAAIKREKERRWLEENKEAIDAHNAWIEKNGMLITPMWMRDDVTF